MQLCHSSYETSKPVRATAKATPTRHRHRLGLDRGRQDPRTTGHGRAGAMHTCRRSEYLRQDARKLQQDAAQYGQLLDRIQQDIQKAWRSLITTFCRHPKADNNFPRWALDTLGEDAVLCCLRAEYSQKALESFWRHRNPKISRDMATWLGLSAPEMMALWFGADDARTRRSSRSATSTLPPPPPPSPSLSRSRLSLGLGLMVHRAVRRPMGAMQPTQTVQTAHPVQRVWLPVHAGAVPPDHQELGRESGPRHQSPWWPASPHPRPSNRGHVGSGHSSCDMIIRHRTIRHHRANPYTQTNRGKSWYIWHVNVARHLVNRIAIQQCLYPSFSRRLCSRIKNPACPTA